MLRCFVAAVVALVMLATPARASEPVVSVNPWEAGSTAVVLALAPLGAPPPYVAPMGKRPPSATDRAPTHNNGSPWTHYATSGSVNGYPCGGDLPPCYVLARESGGNPTARNPHSTASGLWQFLDSTWAGFGGYSRAYLAPPSVQNEKARLLWNHGAGCSHWSAC